jgi:hypothetical protein
MTTFHSRQSDCARRTRKSVNTGTFNFTSQNSHPIRTGMFTKRENSGATFFKSQCSRTVVGYRFYQRDALLLSQAKVFRLANSSSMVAQHPARRSRNVRELSGRTSAKMSCAASALFPGKRRAAATAALLNACASNSQDNLRHNAKMAAPHPRCKLRDRHANSRDASRKLAHRTSFVTSLTMTRPNYESIHIAHNARSRIAA